VTSSSGRTVVAILLSFDQAEGLGGINRLAVEPSLAGPATKSPEHFGLLLGLNALGDDLEVEAFAHHQDGANDMFGGFVDCDLADEAAINLDLVESEFAQPPQARLAGAEIIKRNPDPDGVEFIDHLGGNLRIAHHRGFRDLQFEPARIETNPVDDGQH
jgi:hypothetical protein